MATIHVRTDEKLKKDANKVFEGIGLDMSNAVKLFLTQVVVTKSIPFKIQTADAFTPEEKRRIQEDTKRYEKLFKAGKSKPFSSVDDMIAEILS